MQRGSVLIFRLAAFVCTICAVGLLAWSIAEEQPVGILKGVVIARESSVPLKADVVATVVVNNKVVEERYFRENANAQGRFTFTGLPVGTYRVSISSFAHRMKPVMVTIQESQTEELIAKLTPDPPNLSVFVHQHVFTPDERAQITCSGFLKTDTISVSAYKVSIDQFLGTCDADLRRLVTGGNNYGYGSSLTLKLDDNPGLSRVLGFNAPIKNRDLEGVFTYRVDIPKLAPGLYIVVAAADGIKQVDWLQFTSLGMVTKGSAGKLLAYTVDIKTGVPVPGAEVKIFNGGKPTISQVSDTKGLAVLNLAQSTGSESDDSSDPESGEPEAERHIAAFSGDSVAFTSSWLATETNSRMLVYSYTDRPVYRPGQKVFFRGIARKPVGVSYQTPVNRPVIVEVRDPQDSLIYKTTTTTGKFGSYSGSFTLNEESATGFYSIQYTVDGQNAQESANFRIAEYRKPEFQASVEFSKKRYARGQTIKAKISSAYYFGAPVVNAEVHYSIYRSDYWMYDNSDDESEFQDERYDSSDFGEYVADDVVKTDENGEATIEFPATWPQSKDRMAGLGDQQFTVEVTITDRSNQEATANMSVPATLGDFALKIESDRYIVEPGQSVSLQVKTQDYNHMPVTNQDVNLKIGYNKWAENNYEFVELENRKITTDASGKAIVDIQTGKSGDMQMIAEVRDHHGNRISATESVWVYSNVWQDESGGRIPDLKITTDKKRYNSGDTVIALISAQKTGATALVTVEGEELYDYFTVPITSKMTKIAVPVKSKYRPNFYIGVCYVSNKNLVQQEAMVRVSTKTQVLNVKVESDRKVYKPGETLNATISTTDSKGRPAISEVSLGIVDEAIYAIAEDNTDPINEFFYAKKPNRVRTSFSFPSIYLSDPDKAGTKAATIVRKRFKDTAYWNPTVITDTNGKATVSLTIPDNITSWRSTVRAITSGTVCGEAKSNFIARKDLMVRLEMPRFLTSGDKSSIIAAIHNYTETSTRVKVKLLADGLKIDSDTERTVTIGKNEDVRIDWPVSASKVGIQKITVSAIGDTVSDAVELTLPVIPHGVFRELSSAGMVSGTKSHTEELTVQSDAVLDCTRLKISVQPSLASSMMSSLEYLAQYPYGCTEQTTSAFLPDVIIWQSLKKLGIRNTQLESKLPDMVGKGLSRLQGSQLYDGSWGWCQYGQANLWMSSYVTYALLRANEAGFPVNKTVLDDALSALNSSVSNSKFKPDERAYTYYVLALAGRNVSTELTNLINKKKLNPDGIAVSAMAYANMNQRNNARIMLDRLLKLAVVEKGFLHWRTKQDYGYQTVQATALGLEAMLTLAPDDPRCGDIVRWLMSERHGDYWYSTRDTAATLNAMCKYLEISRELQPSYTASLYLNGKKLGIYKFTQASITQPSITIVVKNGELRKGANILKIVKSGEGGLYYTTNLQQYIERNEASGSVGGEGPAISRAYYKPSPRYFQSKSVRDLGSPINSCSEGDVVLVRIKLKSVDSYEHLLMEDRLPGGFEVMDRGNIDYWDWNYWYTARDIRDRKVSFYIEGLTKETVVAEYQMRAMARGSYAAMPAEIFGMYRPDIRMSTSEQRLVIR